MREKRTTRLYRVRGIVQGVGFRYFAVRAASELGLEGWVRNMEDGSVEALATGTPEQLSKFSGYLRRGPRWADVRAVEEMEAGPERTAGFTIKG